MSNIGKRDIHNAETNEYIGRRTIYVQKKGMFYFLYKNVKYYVELPEKETDAIYVKGLKKQHLGQTELTYTQQLKIMLHFFKQHNINISESEIREYTDELKPYKDNKNAVLKALKPEAGRARIDEYNKSRVYKWLPKNVVDDIANAKSGTKRKVAKCPLLDSIPIAFDARAETEECGVERSDMEKWLSKEE